MAAEEPIPLRLKFHPNGHAACTVREFASALAVCDWISVDGLRDTWLSRVSPGAVDGQALRVAISVLADLRVQGWSIQVQADGTILVVERAFDKLSTAGIEKERVKRGHLRERDYQLAQPAVRQFVGEMERPRVGKSGEWVSIFSLMRDGRELAQQLKQALESCGSESKLSALKKCVDPYLQPVVGDEVCQLTGLRLLDVWRYFRHTWTTHYNSTPGRQVLFLVRDRAAKNHPVIGIGAYGSPVVQLSVRDEWIGWTPQQFVKRLEREPSRIGPRVLEWLDHLISAIYIKDFVREGIITAALLRKPDPRVIQKLNRASSKAAAEHRADPKAAEHKASTNTGGNWESEARSPLFRAKRAKMLALLLGARATFNAVGFVPTKSLDPGTTLRSGDVVRVIRLILRHIKAVHVGVDMADITVCGAIAPYGPILGGKLVSLLLVGPDAVAEYERRYKSAVSVIASSMAGKAIIRTPRLVWLSTTSLYGTSSSQYNRIKVPAEVVDGRKGCWLQFTELGHSTGFGSFHFSSRTIEEIEVLLAQHRDGRPINSIFGEGVNPKIRKLRTGLEAVGFPADVVLNHGDRRLVYGIALAVNFRDVLLGLAKRRVALMPSRVPGLGSRKLAQYWMKRWLAARIERPGIIDAVAAHTLIRPIRHGARVVLPDAPEALATQQTFLDVG